MKTKQIEVNCWNCCWFEPDKNKESCGECTRKCSKNKNHLKMSCDDWCYYFSGFSESS